MQSSKKWAIFCIVIIIAFSILFSGLLINSNDEIRNLQNRNEELQNKLNNTKILLEEYQTSLEGCIEGMNSCSFK